MNISENEPYGIGKTMLEDMTREELKRLYNSGMMPMPTTKEGNYDFKTRDKIIQKIVLGNYNRGQ